MNRNDNARMTELSDTPKRRTYPKYREASLLKMINEASEQRDEKTVRKRILNVNTKQ